MPLDPLDVLIDMLAGLPDCRVTSVANNPKMMAIFVRVDDLTSSAVWTDLLLHVGEAIRRGDVPETLEMIVSGDSGISARWRPMRVAADAVAEELRSAADDLGPGVQVHVHWMFGGSPARSVTQRYGSASASTASTYDFLDSGMARVEWTPRTVHSGVGYVFDGGAPPPGLVALLREGGTDPGFSEAGPKRHLDAGVYLTWWASSGSAWLRVTGGSGITDPRDLPSWEYVVRAARVLSSASCERWALSCTSDTFGDFGTWNLCRDPDTSSRIGVEGGMTLIDALAESGVMVPVEYAGLTSSTS